MPSQFAREAVQKIPLYGVANNTVPTFSGITSAVAQADKSVLVSWSAATGGFLSPARYEIFISPGSISAAVLFAMPKKIEPKMVGATSAQIYVDSDGNSLIAGNTYTFGVRAISASNISDNNTAIDTEVITYDLYSLTQAIKTQTDKFSFDGSNYVNAHTKVNDDKTDYDLDAAATTAIANIQTTVDAIPTLTEIEASTILAKETTSQDIKTKTDNLPVDPAKESSVKVVKNLTIAGL